MNPYDYAEEILIFLYRTQTEILIALQPNIPDEPTDFELSFPGFLENSDENF